MREDQRKRLSEAKKGIIAGMSGKKHSEEARRKMREVHKKEMANPEIRKRISDSVKRLWANPEYRKRISEKLKGKRKGIPISEETKRKISEANKGHLVSEETRQKIREANKGQVAWNKGLRGVQVSYMKGKHHTEEARKKISLAKKGKPSWNKGVSMREESRKKLSQSLKGKHNSPRTQFKKGNVTWNTGQTGVYTPEQLKRMSEARKGKPSWNKGLTLKGIPLGEERIRKQRETMKRLTSSPDYRKRMSEMFKKAWANPELRKKQSERIKKYLSDNPEAKKVLRAYVKGSIPWNKGKKMSVIRKGFVAWNKGITGEKSSSWKGGISFEPYSPEWTDVLKEMIRERDNLTCQLCGKEGYPVHHIDYNKKNCNPQNLVTLCKNCHSKTNWNREKWKKFFSEKIKS